MAIRINCDGSLTLLVWPAGKDEAVLEELQRWVGGLIEFVHFQDGCALMVNENGKLIGLDVNPVATALLLERRRHEAPLTGYPPPRDTVVGPAVYVSSMEMESA